MNMNSNMFFLFWDVKRVIINHYTGLFVIPVISDSNYHFEFSLYVFGFDKIR